MEAMVDGGNGGWAQWYMDTMVDDYRKEKRAAKKKTWFEQIVYKLVGAQVASKYISERKLPKI